MNTNLFLSTQIGFAVLTLAFLLLILRMLKSGIDRTAWSKTEKSRTFRNIVLVLTVWLVFVTIWSASGLMGKFENFPFNFAPVIVIPLVVIVYVVLRSQKLREILHEIPIAHVISLQVFRIFVEVLLWMLFVEHLLPEQMTFEGRNFDILSGLTAALVAWLYTREKISRTVAIVWNLAGLALLINIVTIAILSTPSPWRVFFQEPSNTIVTVFPISFLPGFLVPLAYTLHFFSLKQLLVRETLSHQVYK